MCACFGKWPHELGECDEEEQVFIKSWWNAKIENENEAAKKAGK